MLIRTERFVRGVGIYLIGYQIQNALNVDIRFLPI